MAQAGASPPRHAAIALAGGASTRFGTDKSRAELHGSALLQRVLDAVEPLVDEMLVVGPWAPPGRRHLLEGQRFQGPMAGLAFGLRHIAAPHALVLGGDHPLLQPAVLKMLLGRIGSAHAVVPVRSQQPEPLVACYRASVADVATRLVEGGDRRLRSLLEEVDTAWVSEDEWRTVDPEGLSFIDVDSRHDLDRLEWRPAKRSRTS